MKRKGADAPILQVKVRGPGVRSGRIPVPDLIRICQEAQNAVARQAEALQGRKTIHPGPVSTAIQEECTLELIGIRKGTTTLQFGLAKPQLTLAGIVSPGIEAVSELADTIASLGNDRKKEVDPGVLLALYGLGSLAEGKRISEIDWIPRASGKRKRIVTSLTRKVRDEVAERLSKPRRVIAQVDGILDMADFKPSDRKCRIDPAIGVSITCTFEADKENDIYALLRKAVRVTGDAVLQPYTDRVDCLHIRNIEPLSSLALGEGNFYAQSSIQQLAEAQGVKPLKSVSILHGGIPDDEDIDGFLEEIYNARK